MLWYSYPSYSFGFNPTLLFRILFKEWFLQSNYYKITEECAMENYILILQGNTPSINITVCLIIRIKTTQSIRSKISKTLSVICSINTIRILMLLYNCLNCLTKKWLEYIHLWRYILTAHQIYLCFASGFNNQLMLSFVNSIYQISCYLSIFVLHNVIEMFGSANKMIESHMSTYVPIVMALE